MKVTIVTVTRNERDSLERTIKAVMAQSHPDIEHIVVDGESTDGTAAMLARYPHVKVVSAPPEGVYDAINRGIDAATGDIVGLVHGNDVPASDGVVAEIAGFFATHPDCDYIYGNVRYRDASGRVCRVFTADGYRPSRLKYGIAPPHPGLYVRREVMARVGHYKTDYIISADFDMFARLYLAGARGCHLPVFVAEMSPGGMSYRWRNRLWVNNSEKLRSLRENGLPANALLLAVRYLNAAADMVRRIARRDLNK